MRRTLLIAVIVASAPFALAQTQGVLLVPDSTNDRVLAFDPFSGTLVNPSFIADTKVFGGAGSAYTPKAIIDSGAGTLLLSDQIADAIFEFSYDGTFIREVAGAAQGLDNLRGLAVRNGQVYVTVGGNAGGLNNTIQRFNLDGSGQTTFISTGLNSPFDIMFRGNDVLVSNSSGTADIQRYDLSGNLLGTFHSGAISFVQQLQELADGRVIAAGFSSPSGLYFYDANGNQLSVNTLQTGLRGVYQLGNGNFMVTSGTAVYSIDVVNNTFATLATGGNFQYVGFSAVPEPASVVALGAGLLALARRRRR